MKLKISTVRFYLFFIFCFIFSITLYGCLDKDQNHPGENPGKESSISEGDWTYIRTVTNPGTRSEGSMGRLFYKNRPVPAPENLSDYYDTPMGLFYYAGTKGNPWDDKGWILGLKGETPAGNAMEYPDEKTSPADQTKQHMVEIIKKLSKKVSLPGVFDEMETENFIKELDPWGNAYSIYFDRRGGEGAGEVFRLILKSAGPDKQFNSKDDIECGSGFFPVPGAQNLIGPDDMLPETGPVTEEPS